MVLVCAVMAVKGMLAQFAVPWPNALTTMTAAQTEVRIIFFIVF